MCVNIDRCNVLCYRQMIENELEFDRLAETGAGGYVTKGEMEEVGGQNFGSFIFFF